MTTPRTWLERGKKIRVQNAPPHFGPLADRIISAVNHGKITATVQLPSRNPPRQVLLRLRHPKKAPIRSATVNGQPCTDFDATQEVIKLHGLTGTATVEVNYP